MLQFLRETIYNCLVTRTYLQLHFRKGLQEQKTSSSMQRSF